MHSMDCHVVGCHEVEQPQFFTPCTSGAQGWGEISPDLESHSLKHCMSLMWLTVDIVGWELMLHPLLCTRWGVSQAAGHSHVH